MMLDPMTMVVRHVAGGADGAGNRARRDRRADLHDGALPRVTAGFQVVPVLRGAVARAAGRARELAGRGARAHPARLVQQLVMMVVVTAVMRMSRRRGAGQID